MTPRGPNWEWVAGMRSLEIDDLREELSDLRKVCIYYAVLAFLSMSAACVYAITDFCRKEPPPCLTPPPTSSSTTTGPSSSSTP